jgi:hypothetical protein
LNEVFMDGSERGFDVIAWPSTGLSVSVARCAKRVTQAIERLVVECEDEGDGSLGLAVARRELRGALAGLIGVPMRSGEDLEAMDAVLRRLSAELDEADEIIAAYQRDLVAELRRLPVEPCSHGLWMARGEGL